MPSSSRAAASLSSSAVASFTTVIVLAPVGLSVSHTESAGGAAVAVMVAVVVEVVAVAVRGVAAAMGPAVDSGIAGESVGVGADDSSEDGAAVAREASEDISVSAAPGVAAVEGKGDAAVTAGATST